MPRKKIHIFPLFEEVRRVTAMLTDEQFGKAVRHALSQYYSGEEQEETDGVISLATAMMLEQVNRYDIYREQQRENRTKGKDDSTPRATKVHQVLPNATNNDHRTPRVCPNPNPIPNPCPSNTCTKAVQLLNDLSGSSFRATTKSTQKLIEARIKDGYTPEDVETVIRHQCNLWSKDATMRKYLRPETLFGTKFEGYLSDARRNTQVPEQGYTLAPFEDPWEVAMRNKWEEDGDV